MHHLYLKELGMTKYVDIIVEVIIARGPSCNHNINDFISYNYNEVRLFNKEVNVHIAD